MSERPIHSFTTAIGLISRGRVIAALDDELLDAVRTLQSVGKGKATITLTVTLAAEGDRIDLDAIVKSKLPETRSFSRTPFWISEGGLSTQHPNQTDMFLRPVAERTTA